MAGRWPLTPAIEVRVLAPEPCTGSQVARHAPAKRGTWVRSPPGARRMDPRGQGAMVCHVPWTHGMVGSIPTASTSKSGRPGGRPALTSARRTMKRGRSDPRGRVDRGICGRRKVRARVASSGLVGSIPSVRSPVPLRGCLVARRWASTPARAVRLLPPALDAIARSSWPRPTDRTRRYERRRRGSTPRRGTKHRSVTDSLGGGARCAACFGYRTLGWFDSSRLDRAGTARQRALLQGATAGSVTLAPYPPIAQW